MGKKMKSDCTVLVCSCDKYSDLWFPFFELFRRQWPDCKYRIVLNTESKTYSHKDLNIECFSLYAPNKQIEWGKRMIDHLTRIDTKYVLILLDDFFLCNKVKTSEIEKILEWMKEDQDIATFSLYRKKVDGDVASDLYNNYYLRAQDGMYKCNLQAGVWNKDKLLLNIKKHENPWEWELYGNQRTYFMKDKYFRFYGKEFELPIDYGYISEQAWNVYRGKWVVNTVNDNFERNGIKIDYSLRGIWDGQMVTYENSGNIFQRFLKKCNNKYRRIKSLGIASIWNKI